MKTKAVFKNVLLITSIVFSTVLATANTGPSSKATGNETEKTIHDYFKFPKILIPRLEEKGRMNKVEVLFTTDQNGNVNFVLAKTVDPALRSEIEKQFAGLRLKKVKQNVVHSVVLSFRTI